MQGLLNAGMANIVSKVFFRIGTFVPVLNAGIANIVSKVFFRIGNRYVCSRIQGVTTSFQCEFIRSFMSRLNVTDSRTFADEPNISGLSGPLVSFFFNVSGWAKGPLSETLLTPANERDMAKFTVQPCRTVYSTQSS
jgi:hypothetical protein